MLAEILRTPKSKAKPADTGLTLNPNAPAVAPSRISRSNAGHGHGGVLKSLAQKTLTDKDLAALEELARKCMARRDYDQVIQIVERVPEERRTDGLAAVLAKARDKADEISCLICEIEDAVRLDDGVTALRKADALLVIKPGHHRALKVQEEFAGFGEGARRGSASAAIHPALERRGLDSRGACLAVGGGLLRDDGVHRAALSATGPRSRSRLAIRK